MRHERPIDHSVAPVPDSLHGEPGIAAPGDAATIGLMVVEQQPVSLLGIQRLLHETDVEVVAEVSDAASAVDVAARRHPDVILIDLEVGPTAVIRAITAAAPKARVVVLARRAEDDRIAPALRAGACGCLVVGVSDEIVAAVRAAARGEPYLSAAVAGHLLPQVRGRSDAAVAAARLTPRELEVLRLLARGWDNTRIGKTLFLSRGTVKHHISSILVKLHVENRIQAAVEAVRAGLLDG
jgi:DNA-binding NarL/FixJ family response regulator